MKQYNRLMSELRFRDDFCDVVVKKAQTATTRQRRLPAALRAAACVCLCCLVLLGTALAVSPEFRALLIRNHTVDTVETPALPESSDTAIHVTMDSITAHYYKLDGAIYGGEGFGSLIPVMKDGVLTLYGLNVDGELVPEMLYRKIEKEISYEGNTYTLDLKLYDGDIPTIVCDDRVYPLLTDNIYVLSKTENKVSSPLFVDLDTWEITDPMKNVDFTPPTKTVKTHVSASYGHPMLLIRSQFSENCEHIYCADNRTGRIVSMGEAECGQWFLREGQIYSYRDGVLCRMGDDFEMIPQFEGEQCVYNQGNYAFLNTGRDIQVLELATGREILLSGCGDLFRDPSVCANKNRSKLSFVSFGLDGGGLNTKAIAIADISDIESGEMVTLERIPGMNEQMAGWFDNEHFLICGTMQGQWYACLYKIAE